jgi:UDP-N-acetylglucosamine acyltransferase
MAAINIHETAVVSPDAELGEGVVVGPHAVVCEQVKLGAGTQIGPHAVIHPFATLGEECRVHAGAVIADLPQDLAFDGSESYVEVGARSVLREGVTIHRGTKPGTVTRVGNDCFLMGFTHVAHNACLGNRVISAQSAAFGGYVQVGDGVFASANVLVHQFCRIGRLAMLGGASGISKDVPPFCTAASMRRNRVSGLNVVGMRRAGLKPEERKAIKHVYATIYQKGLTVSDAVKQLRDETDDALTVEMCDFIEASERGICGVAD